MINLKTAIFFLLMGLLIFVLKSVLLVKFIHPKIWIIFTFMFSIALLGGSIMAIAKNKPKDQFTAFYLANMSIRMILALAFLGFMVFLKIELIQIFAINFIVLYLCGLIFEIIEISRNLRTF